MWERGRVGGRDAEDVSYMWEEREECAWCSSSLFTSASLPQTTSQNVIIGFNSTAREQMNECLRIYSKGKERVETEKERKKWKEERSEGETER